MSRKMSEFELGYDYCLSEAMKVIKATPDDPLKACIQIIRYVDGEYSKKPEYRKSFNLEVAHEG